MMLLKNADGTSLIEDGNESADRQEEEQLVH